MKKSRESSHYFSRQYPRRRQIRLPARLQISGTMTMPQGSSRREHTIGAALCSGHGRRRLHSRQRQSPRSAGETSRAVFSSAPIAVFLIQKEKILEIVRFQGFFWSCWADSNCRPRHYQLFTGYFFLLLLIGSLCFERLYTNRYNISPFVICCFLSPCFCRGFFVMVAVSVAVLR